MTPASFDHALLIIDMLNDFVQAGAPLEVPRSRQIIPHIQQRMSEARHAGDPIIYVCDRHQPDDPEFQIWPEHAVRGTEGADIISELSPQPGDVVIPKTTYSGFFETTLHDELNRLGISLLTVTGVCTEICVLYTTSDAFMRGYEVCVPEECVAGLTDEDHWFALKQMQDVLKPYQHTGTLSVNTDRED